MRTRLETRTSGVCAGSISCYMTKKFYILGLCVGLAQLTTFYSFYGQFVTGNGENAVRVLGHFGTVSCLLLTIYFRARSKETKRNDLKFYRIGALLSFVVVVVNGYVLYQSLFSSSYMDL